MANLSAASVALLILACADLHGAVRVEVDGAGRASANASSTHAFVCPEECQECCDSSNMMSSSWKCVFKQTITFDQERYFKEFRTLRRVLKSQLTRHGYQCDLPTRRHKSLFQFKSSCKYKKSEEKPLHKCSAQTMCCCHIESDTEDSRCIVPAEKKWFEYPDDDIVHSNAWDVATPKVVDEVAKYEKQRINPDVKLLDAAPAKYYHFIEGGKEWHPAVKAGQSEDMVSGFGVCEEGVWYWAKPTGVNYGQAPIWSNEGCCLETEKERLWIQKEEEEAPPSENAIEVESNKKKDRWSGFWNMYQKGDQAEKEEEYSWKPPPGEYQEFDVCKRWKQVPLCPEGQMHVEYVGKRDGVCFGDQSTGASLSARYGQKFDSISQEQWNGYGEEAKVSVPRVKIIENHFEKWTRQQCPTGWTDRQGRGLRQLCECDTACGGVGSERLLLAAWNSKIYK